jgi:hypothetical protein
MDAYEIESSTKKEKIHFELAASINFNKFQEKDQIILRTVLPEDLELFSSARDYGII